MKKALVLMTLLVGCSRNVDPKADAMASNAAEITGLSGVPAQRSASAPTGPDAKLTKKRGEDLDVTFVAASRTSPTRAVLAFVLDNRGDTEQPISPMSVQVTTIAGLPAEIDHDAKYAKSCLGLAPPHGRFACQVVCNADVRRVRVRIDGAWFLVDIDDLDGGSKP